MRTFNINDAAMNIAGTASIPDAVCYVFNPNYVDINFGTYSDILLIAISNKTMSYEIEVSLFKGKAKCYISKLMQLFFNDYVSTRSVDLTITLKTKNGDIILTDTTMALWASVEHGMKFGYYLPFVYNRANYPKDVREVVWFKNYPFRVSLFRQTTSNDVYGKSDNNAAKTIVKGGTLEWVGKDGLEWSGKGEFSDVDILSLASVRKAPRFEYEELAVENILKMSATKTIDLCMLEEVGMEVDLERTGITDISQLSEVPLENVVLRKKNSGQTSNSQEITNEWFNWSDFLKSGLDIVSYFAMIGGMTGIFELSPITMFPEAERQLVYTVIKSVPNNAKFDANFNLVFNELTSMAYIVKLIVCNDIDGIYLRWIDQYGFWQYFLFVEGKRTSKNILSSTTINAEYEKDGIYHEAVRNIHVDNTDTIKCCAVNLRKEILAYVETIYKSPHIEMYIGQDFEQNEMWKPVNIVAGSVDIEAKQRLYDYEISITLPDTASQTI